MVEFLTQNPVTQRRDQIRQQRSEQATQDRLRERHELTVAQTRRRNQQQDEDRARAVAVDTAQREAATMPRGQGAAHLANTPGAGKLAMGMADADRKAEEDNERLAVQALAAGDMVTFNHHRQKVPGLNIPDSVIQNQERAMLTGRALTAAEMYKDSPPQQAQAFVRTFIQSNGDLAAAAQAAGVPQAKPKWTIETVMRQGQRTLAMIDTVSGTVRPLQDQQGNPLLAGDHRPVQPSARQRDVQFLISMGMTPDQAVQLSFEAKQNPQAAAERVYRAALSAQMDQIRPPTPEEADRAAQEAVRRFMEFMQGQQSSSISGLRAPPPMQTMPFQGQPTAPVQMPFTGQPAQPTPMSGAGFRGSPAQQPQPPIDPQGGGQQVLGTVEALPPDAELSGLGPDGTQYFWSPSLGGHIEVPASQSPGSL